MNREPLPDWLFSTIGTLIVSGAIIFGIYKFYNNYPTLTALLFFISLIVFCNLFKDKVIIILENEDDKESLDSNTYNSNLIWKKTIKENIDQDHIDLFYNPKSVWSYDIPKNYESELNRLGVQFGLQQMMYNRIRESYHQKTFAQ